MVRRLRTQAERYYVAGILVFGISVIAAWPTLLAPLGRLYVLACGSLLAGLPFGHHYPPLLVAFLAPLVAAALICGLLASARQIAGQRKLDARLRARGGKGTARPDGVVITDDPAVYAFCSGLLRPRVWLSRGLLDLLDDAETEAVVAHELHHARRRDPLRFFVSNLLTFLAPAFPVIHGLDCWLRVRAELAADAAAIERQSAEVLGSAMLKVMRSTSAPARDLVSVGLSPTQARISALQGQSVKFDLSASDVLVSLVTTISLSALGVWLAVQSLPNPPPCSACPAF